MEIIGNGRQSEIFVPHDGIIAYDNCVGRENEFGRQLPFILFPSPKSANANFTARDIDDIADIIAVNDYCRVPAIMILNELMLQQEENFAGTFFAHFASMADILPECSHAVVIDAKSEHADEIVSSILAKNPSAFVFYDERGIFPATFDAKDFTAEFVPPRPWVHLSRRQKYKFREDSSMCLVYMGDYALLGRKNVSMLVNGKSKNAARNFLEATYDGVHESWIQSNYDWIIDDHDFLLNDKYRNRIALAFFIDKVDVSGVIPVIANSDEYAPYQYFDIPTLNKSSIHPRSKKISDMSYLGLAGLHLPETGQQIFNDITKATELVPGVLAIWKETLARYCIRVDIRRVIEDSTQLVPIAELTGIDAQLDAYLNGVPIEDVLS